MSDYLVINSYPRSGSVFLGRSLQEYKVEVPFLFSMHLPFIHNDGNINTIAIFRDPYDCIASHAYMMRNSDIVDGMVNEYNKGLMHFINLGVKNYMLYIDFYIANKDRKYIYGTTFDNMRLNTNKVCLEILEQFKYPYNKNLSASYESVEKQLFDINKMNDRDGHMPREKTSSRLEFEKFIRSLDIFDEALKKFKDVEDLLTSKNFL